MKNFKFIMLLAVFTMFSCGSTKKTLTPNEIKMMTTKQYDEPYELVYKSAMSLLQSEQYTIDQTDYDSGLIIGNKNVFEKKLAHLNKANIIVDKVNDNLTEIKVTVYSGEEKTKRGYYGNDHKTTTVDMVQAPDFYNTFFNKLFAEIERRKALR